MRLKNSLILVAAGGCLLAAGCAPTVTETAEITGQLQQASFPGAASVIEVRDETGKTMRPRVEQDGRFTFQAQSGHEYSMSIVLPSGSEPIVFPRNGGRLDKTFRFAGKAMKADLGMVTHYNSIPAEGFNVSDGDNGQQCGDHEDGDDDNVECEDGIDANTGLTCDDNDHGDESEAESSGPDDDNVECENGIDANTGLTCDDNDDESGGEGAQAGDHQDGPFAVPEHGLPDQLGCGDDEQEGEHEDGDDGEDEDD